MLWHDVEQNGDEWFDLRVGKITMSHANAVMVGFPEKGFGKVAKTYALQLALERIKGVKAEYSFSSKHTIRGHAQEPIARMLYEEENFLQVTNGGFYNCDYYGDSPDGLIGDDGVLEIKSVIAEVHRETKLRGTPDPAYKWQYRGHLACSGRDWVDFVSYCSDYPEGNQIATYRIYREDILEDIAALRVRVKEFDKLVNETILTI